MKKSIYLILLLAGMMAGFNTTAQQSVREKIIKEGTLTSTNEKKFHWGVSYHQYFSGITGETQASYFIKPSIGAGLRAEYYFNSWLGVGLGVAFQQRGAGVNGTDVTGGAFAHPWVFVNTPDGYRSGDPDSTHLERLRFSTLEFPLTVLLRTPKDFLQQGMKLSGAVGPTWIHTSRVNQTYQSIIDGFHPYNWVTDNYTRNNLGLQASIGVDIDSGGGTSLCQIHFVYTTTLSNMYANGTADGRLVTYGVRLAWMF